MVSPEEREQRRAEKQEVVNLIVDEINEKSKRKEPAFKFISDGDLQKIINSHQKDIFKFELWTPSQGKLLNESCYHVLGILLFIGAFTELNDLKQYFFGSGQTEDIAPNAITDKDLWLMDETRLSPLNMGKHLVTAFLACQYSLKAYHFVAKTPSGWLDIPGNVRLPFKDAEKKLGSGHFGHVTEVTVAGGHCTDEAGNTIQSSMTFALKEFKTNRHQQRELRTLGVLKESLRTHNHVMLHYLAFVHGETSFNILLPLAEHGNLEILLNEGYPINDTDPRHYIFQEKFNYFRWQDRKCTRDLLDQMAKIVSGVEWLHEDSGSKKGLVHRDLKPDNILVRKDTREDSSPSSKSSSIGQWCLSDLGISVEHNEGGERDGLITIGDFVSKIEGVSTGRSLDRSNPTGGSRNYRPPGSYTAPEVEYNRYLKKSDVWSLGCILAEVLAFAKGGRKLVLEFFEHRRQGTIRGESDRFYIQDLPNSNNPKSPRYTINPAAKAWLENFASGEAEWVQCGVHIVLQTLVVDLNHRPSAEKLYTMLQHLIEHHDRSKNEICPNISQSLSSARSAQRSLSPITSPTISHGRKPSSVISENRRDIAATIALSQLQLSLSRQETFQVSYLHKRESTSRGNPSGKLSPSATSIAISPSGELLLWLFKIRAKPPLYEIDIVPMEIASRELQGPVIAQPLPMDSVGHTFALPSMVEWKELEVSDQHIVAQGTAISGGHKRFNFYDFGQQIVREIPIQPHSEMPRVKMGQVTISVAGFAVLQASNTLLLYDLKSTGRTTKQDLKLVEDYTFSVTRFSPSGDLLIAWCWGTGLDDALFVWKLSETGRIFGPPQKYTVQTAPNLQYGVHSLIPSPEENDDGSLNCVVRECADVGGKFFFVRLGTERQLTRNYLTRSSRAVAAACYKRTDLIILEQPHLQESKITSYPLRVQSQQLRDLAGNNLGKFATESNLKLHIIPHKSSLSFLALSLTKPMFRRQCFRYEQAQR